MNLVQLSRLPVAFHTLPLFHLRAGKVTRQWKSTLRVGTRLRAVSFSSDLVGGVQARASIERQSRETRETRAAAREDKRSSGLSTLQFSRQKITRPWKTILSGFAGSLFFVVPLPSLAFSHAWSFTCLGRFARRTKKKERLLVV